MRELRAFRAAQNVQNISQMRDDESHMDGWRRKRRARQRPGLLEVGQAMTVRFRRDGALWVVEMLR